MGVLSLPTAAAAAPSDNSDVRGTAQRAIASVTVPSAKRTLVLCLARLLRSRVSLVSGPVSAILRQ